MSGEFYEPQGPVIRDKRRIDPETGEVRVPRTDAEPSPTGQADAPSTAVPAESEAEIQLAERTADLQRLQAEYVNYKRRVDRDREATRQAAVASVLTSLLPVLDDIARAREHDELTGGFKAVAESLQRSVAVLGLVPFGEAGDDFDPRIHEALMHSYADEVDGPVCQEILQVGYRLGDRIIRPARVAVAEPNEPRPPIGPDTSGEGSPMVYAATEDDETDEADGTDAMAPGSELHDG